MAELENPSVMPKVVAFLSSLLKRVAESNDHNQQQLLHQKISVFHGLTRPTISIQSYLERIFKLLITSVMVAAKFMDDMYYNNAYYAKVGGITTIEMNFLEVDFLFGLGFHLNVTPGTFQAYCAHLQKEMLMMQPQLDFENSSSLSLGKSLKTHLCFNDDESSHQNQQQQQQQQLAV
ncbi:hypothetical protein AAHE18_14G202900 [Arachis hypogaea]